MRKLFLWFYCLPILKAVILILLGTVLFLLLRKRFGDTPYWKVGIPLLFICWIAVILFGTLGQRTEGGNFSEPILTPFYSYYIALTGGNKELYRTNFMNAVLFYPAGLLGCALLSIGIEYSQYHFGLGLTEVDDVIHNTLGTLLGAVACGASIKLHKK